MKGNFFLGLNLFLMLIFGVSLSIFMDQSNNLRFIGYIPYGISVILYLINIFYSKER